MEGWKIVGGWKSGRMKSGRMEKWEDGKLFCLVEKKSGRIEKVVYIN